MAFLRLGVLCLGLCLFGGAASALDAVKGHWQRGDGKTRVKVSGCGKQKLCVRRTWIKPGYREDDVGSRFVVRVKRSGKRSWQGTAHDLQKKKKFTLRMSVSGNRLTTHGCVLGGNLCRSASWTRIGSRQVANRGGKRRTSGSVSSARRGPR